jgi:hypothetical protein
MSGSDLPKDLHTAEGALQFAEMVFANAKAKFDQRGAIGAASFLLIAVNPQTDEPFEDGPKVSVVEGSNMSVENHEATVRKLARDYKAVGVLTLFESFSSEDETDNEGLTESADLNEFLGGSFEEEDTAPGSEPVVLVAFEHLRFKPRVRVWAAPVMAVDDDKVLGAFEEDTGVDRVEHFGSFLTFYD